MHRNCLREELLELYFSFFLWAKTLHQRFIYNRILSFIIRFFTIFFFSFLFFAPKKKKQKNICNQAKEEEERETFWEAIQNRLLCAYIIRSFLICFVHIIIIIIVQYKNIVFMDAPYALLFFLSYQEFISLPSSSSFISFNFHFFLHTSNSRSWYLYVKCILK